MRLKRKLTDVVKIRIDRWIGTKYQRGSGKVISVYETSPKEVVKVISKALIREVKR